VGLDEALVVAVHRTRLARPRIRQNQRALAGPFDRCTVRSYQRRTNAEERRARGPGFLRPGSGEGRQNEAAGLRLPPCIDDGATAIADDLVIPAPGFGV